MLAPTVDPVPAALIITHCHWGHYSGLGWLGKECLDARGLPVYCTPVAAQFLSENRPWSDLVARSNITLMPMVAGAAVDLPGGTAVRPTPVRHRADSTDTVALSIQLPKGQRVLYLPDIDDLDAQAVALIRHSDLAFIDGTFYDTCELTTRAMEEVPHPLVLRSAPLLSSEGLADRTVFTHLNHTNPIADMASPERKWIESMGFRVAADGMCITLR